MQTRSQTANLPSEEPPTYGSSNQVLLLNPDLEQTNNTAHHTSTVSEACVLETLQREISDLEQELAAAVEDGIIKKSLRNQ